MSAAAAKSAETPEKTEGEEAPAPKRRLRINKKIAIIIAAALTVVVLGGGFTAYVLKKRADAAREVDAEETDDDLAAAEAAAEAEHRRSERLKHPPIFVPLDPFTVNLADRDTERYAQIGITLEMDDQKWVEQMKVVMPTIRNGILLILSHKTSQELVQRDGKEQLANEIMREAVRPLGIDEDSDNPIRSVLFSSFIIQ